MSYDLFRLRVGSGANKRKKEVTGETTGGGDQGYCAIVGREEDFES